MNRIVKIIMNPRAGKQTAKTSLFTICDRFCAMQDQVIVQTTQYAGHAKELAIQSEHTCDLLVCIGGDGTWNEVINGIMEIQDRPLLAYLPSGTVNDFAATLQLPKSAEKMMDIVEKERPFSFDIGAFNQCYFTYVAAFGLFTEISYTTPQSSKNIFGRIAYFLEGVKQLTNIPQYKVRAIIDDKKVIEDTFIFGCITNSKYVAGFPAFDSDNAQLDDGFFEILFIKVPMNPLDVQTIITALLKHEVNETWMYSFKANHVRVESEDAIPWTLDGEDGGSTHLAQIDNRKQAATILK